MVQDFSEVHAPTGALFNPPNGEEWQNSGSPTSRFARFMNKASSPESRCWMMSK